MSKEYIRLGGQVIAIENAVPSAPIVNVSPLVLQFGAANTTLNVTVTNTGNAAAAISPVQVSDTADFSFSNRCGSSLAAGGSCAISVTFTPMAAGTLTATLIVNAAGSQYLVTLTGAGLLTVSPPNLSFVNQTVGTTSASQNVNVTNNGNAAAAISSVQVSDTTDFSVSNGCGSSVAAGGTCMIGVTFTPVAAVTSNATLTINAAGSQYPVGLSGTGTTGTPAGLTTYVGAYGSGVPTYTGATVTLPLRVYVPGGPATLDYLQADLVTPGGGYMIYLFQSAGVYSLELYDSFGNYAPQSDWLLTANGQVTPASVSLSGLQITATQLTVVGNEVQLNLTLASSGTFSYQVRMGAQATSGYSMPWLETTAAQWSNGPAIVLTPTSYTFPLSQNVGTASASQTITVTNSGSAAVAISSIAASGGNADDFSVRGDACPSSLAAGASCAVTVVFTPSAAGSRATNLVVQDSAPGSPHSASLSGTGTGTEQPPTVLTTYVGVWGDPVPSYTGGTVMLPLRLYSPAGFGSLGYLQVNLVSSGATYRIYLFQNSGVYTLEMQDTLGNSDPWPLLALAPNGLTTAAAVSLPEGIQITWTRLGIVGNELQLDLTLAQSGSFNYQVQLGATTAAGYSVPWFAMAATWGN